MLGHGAGDVVGGVERRELLGDDDDDLAAEAAPEQGREAATDGVAEHVVDDDVVARGVEEARRAEGVDGPGDGAPAAADARVGPPGLDAVDTARGRRGERLRRALVALGPAVDHGLDEAPAQEGGGGVALGVAADVEHAPARQRQRRADVRGDGRLADAALAEEDDLLHARAPATGLACMPRG